MDWQATQDARRFSSGSATVARRAAASPKARALTLTATSLGFVVVQLDVTIVNVALQRIGATFGGGVAGLQWIVDAYTLVFASLILTAGALGDRLGAKRVFIAGFLIFTAGSAVCGLAPDLLLLILGRVIQGIGAAVLVPCSLALLHHTYQDEKARAKAVAVWAAGASVALAAGPVIGGILINGIGWRTIFFINLPLGAIGIWLTLKYAGESSRAQATPAPTRSGDVPRRPSRETHTSRSHQRTGGLDLTGQVATILALASLATAAIESGRLGFGAPIVIGSAVVFIAAAIAFVVTESRSASPMLPLSLFRNATFSAAIATGLLINIAYYGLIFLFSLFFQQGKSYSPLLTGTAFLPMTAGVLGANLLAGHMTAHGGPRTPMLIGLAMFAGGCLLLVFVTPETSFLYMGGQMLLMGVGVGFVVPPMTAAVLSAVERRQSGVASGALNATRQAGSVIGVALYGALIADKARLTQGTHEALYISAALLLIACAASARYVKSQPKRGSV